MKLLNRSLIVRTASANSTRKTWLIAGFAMIMSLSLASPVAAQRGDEKERKTKQTVAMSQPVYEALTEIQELVESDQFAEAQKKITGLQESRKKLSPYEAAQIWNISGYTYYLQEDYKGAIRSYENVLAQPELPEALQQSTLKTMAQLYFTVEDYPKALTTIERLMAIVPEPAADVYMLVGQAHFQMGNYKKAIEPIITAIDMYREQGKVPRENWLLLLRVCYWELQDFPNMLIVLKPLPDRFVSSG